MISLVARAAGAGLVRFGADGAQCRGGHGSIVPEVALERNGSLVLVGLDSPDSLDVSAAVSVSVSVLSVAVGAKVGWHRGLEKHR